MTSSTLKKSKFQKFRYHELMVCVCLFCDLFCFDFPPVFGTTCVSFVSLFKVDCYCQLQQFIELPSTSSLSPLCTTPKSSEEVSLLLT